MPTLMIRRFTCDNCDIVAEIEGSESDVPSAWPQRHPALKGWSRGRKVVTGTTMNAPVYCPPCSAVIHERDAPHREWHRLQREESRRAYGIASKAIRQWERDNPKPEIPEDLQ